MIGSTSVEVAVTTSTYCVDMGLDQQLMVFGSKTNSDGTATDLGGFTADSLPAEFEVKQVEFAPCFPSLTGEGISVDLTTGVLDTTAVTPVNLRNFLVSANVHHNTAGLTNLLVTFIRMPVYSGLRPLISIPHELHET